MTYVGSGTRASPIAIDDSEDEVVNELHTVSSKSSPIEGSSYRRQNPGPRHDVSRLPPPPNMNPVPPHASKRRRGSILGQRDRNPQHEVHPLPRLMAVDSAPPQIGKRKRGDSIGSQPGPSHAAQRPHPSLANRITHPPAESKKARKRRRRMERQAAEEARLQNINWLNNAFTPQPAGPPLNFPGWSQPQPSYEDHLMAMQAAVQGYTTPQPMYRYPYEDVPYGEPLPTRSPSPLPPQPPLSPPPSPPRTSDWVSSMSMASLQDREPLSPPPPPSLPPPPMPPVERENVSGVVVEASAPAHAQRASVSVPKPPEQLQHALPPKPVQIIGMKPDQDPNSKHGIFQITSSTKEGGTAMKTRPATAYMPNPARTLVMESLPKTHRTVDFINKWSRGACSAQPVHIFIDGQAAKALIEFATAELARTAWGSPRLGQAMHGQKTHLLKGKPREDLIKVWWYRVDGVGAEAGVGEIEEGEIEDDPAAAPLEGNDAMDDGSAPKETKKERKARMAKEREAKRLKLLALKNERELAEAARAAQAPATQPEPHVAGPSTQEQPSATTPSLHTGDAAFGPQNPFSSAPPSMLGSMQGVSDDLLPGFNLPLMNPLDIMAASALAYPPMADFIARQMLYTNGLPQTQWPAPHFDGAGFHGDRYPGSHMNAAHQYREDDRESIASSTGRSPKPPPQSAMSKASTYGQADDLDDYEDMDVEFDDDASPPPSTSFPQPFVSDQGWAGRAAHLSASGANISTLPNRPQTDRAHAPRHAPNLPPKPKPLPASSAAAAVFVPRHQPTQHAPTQAEPLAGVPSANGVIFRPGKIPAPSSSSPSLVTSAAPKASPQIVQAPSAASVIVTPVVSVPPSLSTTPTPSEPKAMKNAPTAPSFTKRALMARQKELEERIAQSKLEIAAAAATSSAPASGTSTPALVPPKRSVDAEDKQAMEDRLRKLVLQSRKSIPKPEAPPMSVKQEVVSPPIPSVAPASVPPAEKTPSAGSGFSLEDMAVSFITEAIEAVKTLPAPPPPSQNTVAAPAPVPPQPTTKTPSQPNAKSDLAAKQKRLEEHITTTKALMEQFAQAKTKEAKDQIMKIIREKTRLFESQLPATGSSKPVIAPTTKATSVHHHVQGARTATVAATTQYSQITRWPVSHRDAGVLILSDDEDEDDEDEDDEDGDEDEDAES